MSTTTVSGLTAATDIQANDLLYVSRYVSPGVYASRKVAMPTTFTTLTFSQSVQLSITGALSPTKGILFTADDDFVIGYDQWDTSKYSIRSNIAGADADYSFEWSSGPTVNRNIIARLTGAGNMFVTGQMSATNFYPTGITGATSTSRYVGATTGGAPVAGTFAIGDYVVDRTGAIWICTVAGTPGTWVNIGTNSDLWEVVSTNYLRPKAGNGYIGVRLYNSGQTQNVRISYESNGVYYDASDTAVAHRFWQTLQAETNIQMNNSGALNQTKGINLTTADDDYIIGYDNYMVDKYSMRFSIASADADSDFAWTAGAFLDRTVVMSVTGLGSLRVSGSVVAPYLSATGLTGATGVSRYVGATSSGAPVSGTFAIGDYVIDRAGAIWICTVAGSPGTWVNAGTGSDLWDVVSTTYLRPRAGNGYIGVKLYNSDQSQNVRISYESNGVYYDSSDTSAVHRFWQTLQAETYIKLNTTGTLNSTKGISVYGSNDNYKIGYDDLGGGNNYIRYNVLNAATTDGHIWSAGTLGSSPATLAILNGKGRLRVYNEFSTGAAAWTGVFGTTTGEDPVVLGWRNEVATIAAVDSAALTTFQDLTINANNLTLESSYLYAPAAEFDGAVDITSTLDVTGVTTLSSTLGVTGAATFSSTVAASSTVSGIGDTAAILAKGSSNNNRQLSIGFNASLDICQITATKVGTGIMGLEFYGNHVYMQATSNDHAEIGTNFINLTSPAIALAGTTTAVSGSTWYGIVAGGTGGTDRVVIGNLSGFSTIGGHNSALNAWANLYINPASGANTGIGLNTAGGQTANAQLHGGVSTILGAATSAIADGSIYAGQVNIWVNEGLNLLTFKVKYSGGTVKSGTVALS